MFDVAIYTDTRANEAVDGIDGFNFQALSEGMTAQDRQVIRDYMLHRVVVGWNVDHDPLEHPASFSYRAHAGRYYLSRGISTGVTNNGRPGNLLTEAIATSDPDDFGMMRPAQFLGARNWSLKKASSQTLPRWAAPLDVTQDFEADALSDMVKNDAWAVAHFAEFLAVVEQVTDETPKRLVIVTADEALARKWIALGTLFIERERSLSLSIRGLVQDPMTTKADIVAASPAFGPQPDPSVPRAGVNVIDLDRRLIAPLEASESALTQADWFLHEDSATALAAIDVARCWEGFLGRDLATRAAALASFPKNVGDHRNWLVAMQALRGLAITRQDDDLMFYGDDLLDLAVTCAVETPEDAKLAGETIAALTSTESQDLAAGVLMSVLESVSGIPRASEALLLALSSARPHGRLTWKDEAARAQASILLSQVAETSEDALLPATLTVARTCDVPIADVSRAEIVARVARLWASSPDLTEQSATWEHREEIVEELARVLVRRWCSGGQDDLRTLMQGTWTWLTRNSALTPTMRVCVEQWNSAVIVARLPIGARAAQLRTMGQIPPDSWRLVWSQAKLPANYELFMMRAQTQREITGEAGEWLFEEISAALKTGEPAVSLRELLVSLHESGIVVRDRRLSEYAAQVHTVAQYCCAALGSSTNPNPYLPTVIAYVPTMSPLMLDFLGAIILRCPDTRGVAHLVGAYEEWARESVYYFLNTRESTVRGMAETISLAAGARQGRLNAPAVGAEDFLLEVCDDRVRRGLVYQAATEQLVDRRVLAAFEDFARDAKKGRFKRKLSRVAIGLVNRKGRDN